MDKKIITTAFVLFLVVFFVGCITDDGNDSDNYVPPENNDSSNNNDTTPHVDTYAYAALELETFNEINKKRAENGLGILEELDELTAVARIHSQNMIDHDLFSHTGYDGKSPFDRLNAAGITWMSAAENIGMNSYPNTVDTAVNGWMNSPGHKTNILGQYTKTGVGIAKSSNGEYYFTQVFIVPKQ